MSNRILMLNVELSGINKYLLAQLQKKDWELTVVNVPYPKICRYQALISTFRPNLGDWKRRFNEKLVKLYKTPWTFLQRTKFCQQSAEKLNSNFDLIFQISGMFSPALELGKLNKPYVTYNDYTMALSQKYAGWVSPRSKLNAWLKLEKELYINASLIFTTNENARRSFIKDYSIAREKIINVGCGLNLNEIPDFTKIYDGKTILFVGIDFERKGGFVLLDAFKKVKDVIPDAKLIIVGPNKDMLEINESGVEILGHIQDKEKIKRFYEQTSIFVMPSLCEPFGLVFLEAMAYRLPCIGAAIDAMHEIIEDGKTGFLVSPKDSLSLANKIIFLLRNAKLMKKMGEAGYLRVQEKYRWDKVADKIDCHLKKIVKK